MQAETRNKTVWDLFLQWRHLNSGFTRRRLHLDRLSAFLATRLFMTLVGVLIVCNGVFVGIVSNSVMERTLDEYHRRGLAPDFFAVDTPDWESRVEECFAIVFSVELALR